MLNIIGGTYREICLVPDWNRVFGSGARAAIAASQLCNSVDSSVKFYTCATKYDKKEIDLNLSSFGIETHYTRRTQPIEFQYNHSVDKAVLFPDYRDLELVSNFSLPDSIDNALIFSLIELQELPRIKGKRIVYDPQAGSRSVLFSSSGSQYRSLAIVCNLGEARALARLAGVTNVDSRTPNYLANRIIKKENASGIVIKMGHAGAHVVTKNGACKNIPAYKTDRVFGIGSGDIFSAVFASAWAEIGKKFFTAAAMASAATAYYCDTTHDYKYDLPTIPIDVRNRMSNLPPMNTSLMTKKGALRTMRNRQIYLAGPFFNLAQVWMVDECGRCLREMGLDVWSPMAELGVLAGNASINDIRSIVKRDLAQLDSSGSVFAILDGLDAGTIFEIGYAVCKGIPVTILVEQASNHDLTMFRGSPSCKICNDLPAALYHCGWKAHGL